MKKKIAESIDLCAKKDYNKYEFTNRSNRFDDEVTGVREEKKKTGWRAVLWCGIGISVVGLGLLAFLLITSYFPKQDYSEYTSSVVSSEPELPKNPIDFAALQENNADVYAWIRIPNTKIDYPIVQHPENDGYYLNHDADKKYTKAGAIYSEMKTRRDFSDPNTVIYGHNMLNGTMFQNLHKFKQKDFFEENQYIYIYTPGHILTYEICAAYRYDNRHILNSFNFSDPEVFADYLEYVKDPQSIIKRTRTVEMDQNTKLLTLSTCIGNHDYRYLVQGVLIRDEKTK